MSIDFDSAALQTQHDEEEYDQEDYAREQEVYICPEVGTLKQPRSRLLHKKDKTLNDLHGGFVIVTTVHCCSGIETGPPITVVKSLEV